MDAKLFKHAKKHNASNLSICGLVFKTTNVQFSIKVTKNPHTVALRLRMFILVSQDVEVLKRIMLFITR